MKLELLLFDHGLRAGGRCRARNLIAVLLEICDEQRKDGGVVLDNAAGEGGETSGRLHLKLASTQQQMIESFAHPP